MNAPHPAKVAGIDSTVPSPAHTVAPATPGRLPGHRAERHGRRRGHGGGGSPLRPRRPAPGPAGRLGVGPDDPARADRAPGPYGLPLRRSPGSTARRSRPGWAPGAVSSSWNRPTDSARTPPSASDWPAPTSAISRPSPEVPCPTGGFWTGCRSARDGITEPDLFAGKNLDPRHREVAAPPRLRRQLRASPVRRGHRDNRDHGGHRDDHRDHRPPPRRRRMAVRRARRTR